MLAVAVETPRHSGVGGLLDYTHPHVLPAGTLVAVPLGKRGVPGIVWQRPASAAPAGVELRPISAALTALPPLGEAWRALIDFAALYYQRGVGELALSVLPPELRQLDNTQLLRRMKRLPQAVADAAPDTEPREPPELPELSEQQAQALDSIASLQAQATPAAPPPPMLLHGVTGSGKTEVYLRAAAAALARGQQALVLVPEINLTPQLEARFAARFPGRVLVSLHSALTPAQRLRHWLLAHTGAADLVLGTRLAVFASLPRLGLVVVDEEHDPSFKQQEGARYSARDLAVWRAHQAGVAVLLGSATPSLETWQRVQGRQATGGWRWTARIGGGAMPRVRHLRHGQDPCRPRRTSRHAALAPPLLAGHPRARVERGEQSLLLLNRRGYAPVLHCGACGWKSGCPHCSAWRVFHKLDRTLRCHHCGFTRTCAACLPRLRQPRHRTGRPRHREARKSSSPTLLPERARRTHRRRQHPCRRRAREPALGRCACRRSRRARGHADGGQGPRLPAHHAWWPAVNADAALFSQRLPRARAPVCAADAGRRPRRA